MDASVVEFLTRNQRTVSAIVDQTFFRLMEPITPLDMYMPLRNYVSRKILLLKFKGHRPTVASIVAEEQEIPASRPRATLDEQLLSNLKFGKKVVYKARDFELMYELMRYGMESGAHGEEMIQEIKKYFFGLVADLVAPLIEKHTILALQIATTGSCTFSDPLTNAQVSLSYPNLVGTHFPSALTTTRRWTQAASATPLVDLEAHARAYYDTLGMWPETVFMHFSTLRQIADTTEAKTAYLRTMGADATTPDVTGVYLSDEMVMDQIKTRIRGQKVELLDAQYSEEQEDGSIVDKFFLPENYYFFAKPNFMERAMVPTVEKGFAPGIFTHSKVVEESPRIERSVAVANGLPLVLDERCLAARKVA